MAPNTSITVLVHDYANGDKGALGRLLPLLYAELRCIAQKHLRRTFAIASISLALRQK